MREKQGVDELLARVQRVEEPPFLYTRIAARLEAEPVRSGFSRIFAPGLVLAFVLLLNLAAMLYLSVGAASSGDVLGASIAIDRTEQWYHD